MDKEEESIVGYITDFGKETITIMFGDSKGNSIRYSLGIIPVEFPAREELQEAYEEAFGEFPGADWMRIVSRKKSSLIRWLKQFNKFKKRIIIIKKEQIQKKPKYLMEIYNSKER